MISTTNLLSFIPTPESAGGLTAKAGAENMESLSRIPLNVNCVFVAEFFTNSTFQKVFWTFNTDELYINLSHGSTSPGSSLVDNQRDVFFCRQRVASASQETGLPNNVRVSGILHGLLLTTNRSLVFSDDQPNPSWRCLFTLDLNFCIYIQCSGSG